MPLCVGASPHECCHCLVCALQPASVLQAPDPRGCCQPESECSHKRALYVRVMPWFGSGWFCWYWGSHAPLAQPPARTCRQGWRMCWAARSQHPNWVYRCACSWRLRRPAGEACVWAGCMWDTADQCPWVAGSEAGECCRCLPVVGADEQHQNGDQGNGHHHHDASRPEEGSRRQQPRAGRRRCGCGGLASSPPGRAAEGLAPGQTDSPRRAARWAPSAWPAPSRHAQQVSGHSHCMLQAGRTRFGSAWR